MTSLETIATVKEIDTRLHARANISIENAQKREWKMVDRKSLSLRFEYDYTKTFAFNLRHFIRFIVCTRSEKAKKRLWPIDEASETRCVVTAAVPEVMEWHKYEARSQHKTHTWIVGSWPINLLGCVLIAAIIEFSVFVCHWKAESDRIGWCAANNNCWTCNMWHVDLLCGIDVPADNSNFYYRQRETWARAFHDGICTKFVPKKIWIYIDTHYIIIIPWHRLKHLNVRSFVSVSLERRLCQRLISV